MSRTTTVIIITVLLISGFAFSRVEQPMGEKQLSLISETPASHLRITRKLRSELNISIRPATDVDFEPNRPYGVIAELKSDRLLKDVHLSWTMPSHVTLVSGAKYENLGDIQPGETKQFTIVVSSPSAENAKVFAHAAFTQNGRPFRETAQYHAAFQKQIDEEKAALALRTKETIEAQQGQRLKIFK